MHRHGTHMLLIYSAYVKNFRKNWNTTGQSISHLQTSTATCDFVRKQICRVNPPCSRNVRDFPSPKKVPFDIGTFGTDHQDSRLFRE
jgi:hypothetical protein